MCAEIGAILSPKRENSVRFWVGPGFLGVYPVNVPNSFGEFLNNKKIFTTSAARATKMRLPGRRGRPLGVLRAPFFPPSPP